MVWHVSVQLLDYATVRLAVRPIQVLVKRNCASASGRSPVKLRIRPEAAAQIR